jgi:hypothetical protein
VVFVRGFYTKRSQLFDGAVPSRGLWRHFFNPKQLPGASGGSEGVSYQVSAYVAASDVEEATAAAALEQKRDNGKIDGSAYLLRVRHAVFEGVGVTVDEARGATARGTTGVRRVDVTHVNLRGTEEGLVLLLDRLRGALLEGHDLVREVYKSQMRRQIVLFAQLEEPEIDIAAKERCLRLLE